MDQLNDGANPGRDWASGHAARKTAIIIGLIALTLLIGLWIWKSIEISNIKERALQDLAEQKKVVQNMILQTHEEHLKLFAKPFVWAIRTEMMQGNMKQVNLYLNEMVKQKSVQSIIIANNNGIIVASTNKKFEGKPFTSVGKPNSLVDNSPTVERASNSVIILNSPIMGFNNRIGTVMINFKPEKIDF